jgi:phosphoribosylpyrophosphate synthetase
VAFTFYLSGTTARVSGARLALPNRSKSGVSEGSLLQRSGGPPTPRRHYDTMQGVRTAIAPTTLVLVDDVVTEGATLAGAAAHLNEMFRAFRML